jgi:hypothetical protein
MPEEINRIVADSLSQRLFCRVPWPSITSEMKALSSV